MVTSRKVMGSMLEVNLIKDWRSFYSKVFGIKVNFSKLKIPDKKRGFNRLIIVAEGMSYERLFSKCEELFPSWRWTFKNSGQVISERAACTEAYAVWFRNQIEADEDLKNLSANDLRKRGIPGITLEERLLFELKHFEETGKHLDVGNITLCAGSRYVDYSVPCVRCSRGELLVSWCSPGESHEHLRSRYAVF